MHSMASLVLDHVFVIVEGPARAVPLAAAGLTVHGGRRHPDQGTENRCIFFEEHFLELLFVHDMAEARANMLRLDARNPIGLALRSAAPEPLPLPSVVYRPTYGAGRFTIDVTAARDQPLLFAMRPPSPPPSAWGHLARADRVHPCGARRIAHLSLEGPGAAAWAVEAPWLSREEARAWRLTVWLEGAPGLDVVVSPHLSVRGR